MLAFVVESYIWYACVILVAASRFISRRMTLGAISHFQPDDWLMLVVLCFYTALLPNINIVVNSNSNLLPPGFDVASLTKADIQERTFGSKLILVVEQCQIATVWGAKACLLILYLRLTTFRRENIAIKVLAGYVAFGFVFMEVFYFGVWCRPFHDYWAVPTPNVQCDAATNHLITNAVFNLSSDVAMLAIGLPMFLRMQLPLKQKLSLVGVFSLGVFVILAAILNKVYSFTDPFGSKWTFWYIRESSTALLVANLPFVWTFWKKAAGSATTVIGLSPPASASPAQGLSRSERSRQDSGRPSPTLPFKRLGLDGELEMEEGAGRRVNGSGVTLADMLDEGNPAPATSHGNEVSLYTHPQLYFSKNRRTPGIPRTGLIDKETAERVRRSSSLDMSPFDTPAPAGFSQSLSSRKSTGSFV